MKNMIVCALLTMATILLPDFPLPPDTECVTHRIWVPPTDARVGYWSNIKVCTKVNKPEPTTSNKKENK